MILANIQWIGRQPLVSAIVSSIVSPSGSAFNACQPEASDLRDAYDIIAQTICQSSTTAQALRL